MISKWVVYLSVAAMAGVVLVPVTTSAQQTSAIAGVAKDASGAVLPGVRVEAASPALIEKVRTVVTDGQGQYKIIELLPGNYVITFSLGGFNTVRREGIVLTPAFTASVNVELRAATGEGTETVTGDSPLVDSQNVLQQKTTSAELLKDLPSATGSLVNVTSLNAGVTAVADVGGALGGYRSMGTPQGVGNHGRVGMKVTFDGLGILGPQGEGNTSYQMNSLLTQAMVLQSGGISAENASSGVSSNGVPKQGGNTFSFSANGMFVNNRLQSDNLTDALRARGLTTLDSVVKIWDSGVTFGGPIKRDRLWFFAAIKATNTTTQKAGIFWNKTQGTPFYTPDPSRPGHQFESDRFEGGRVTWQASARNKVNGFADVQNVCKCEYEGFTAPEANAGLHFWPQGLYQVSWSSPLTSKLLLEAGVSSTPSTWPTVVQPCFSTTSCPSGVDAYRDISILELSTNFPYNAATSYGWPASYNRWAQRFSVAYITGSHAFKAGMQDEPSVQRVGTRIDHKVGFQGEPLGNVSYRFLNGVPNGITQYVAPYLQTDRVKADLGLYVQDQWTVKRLTLNYGLRFDYFNGYVPAQHVPAGEYVGARDFAPVSGVPAWKDLNPRVGGSYDLFGNSKTAIKAAVGRYVSKSALSAVVNNPITTSVTSVTRTWNDANGNYVADCDLHNPAANGECGAFQNVNFGKNNPSATRYADDVLHGFGARPSNWDFSTEVQHQLSSAVSVSGGYYRNWHSHFQVTANQAATPADYSPFCITAPLDARLPGGGGYQVCGLADVVPAKFGQFQNVVTHASNFGKQTRVNNFFSVSVTTRFGGGVNLGGGVDTGRTVNDRCFVVNSLQDLLYCHVVTPFKAQTQFKVNGSYPLPGKFVVSGVFQNVAGPTYNADYQAPNALIAPSLGRNLAACGTRTLATCTATVTVPLIAPQTGFEARRTQLDLRLTKLFNLRSKGRLQANVDLYNALNAASLMNPNFTYGPRWRDPTTSSSLGAGVLMGRMIEFSGRLSF